MMRCFELYLMDFKHGLYYNLVWPDPILRYCIITLVENRVWKFSYQGLCSVCTSTVIITL